jgi:hypothetical protein
MGKMNITIKKIERSYFELPGSTIVAQFDATVGDFMVKRATLHETKGGGYAIGCGGGVKARTAITLPKGCETRDRLTAAAVEAYCNVRS